MANTFTALIYHVVFSTRQRAPLLDDAWGEQLHAYIGGTLRSLDSELLCAGGVEDHIHLIIRTKPAVALSKVVGSVKANASRWLNESDRADGGFAWQRGYSAFSVGSRDVAGLRGYLARQRQHHGVVSYRDELVGVLEAHDMAFEERFLLG